MQLDWKTQVTVVTQAVQSYCGLAVKHRLPVQRAVEMFNVYLMPRIEAGLRYIHMSGWLAQFEQWDKSLVRAIGQVCKLPVRFNRGAIATLTGLILPSAHAQVVRISEAFIRCNSNAASVWVQSGQQRWLQGVGSAGAASVSRFSATNRLVQVHAMARDQLNWCMHPVQRSRSSQRRQAVLSGPPTGAGCVVKSVQIGAQLYPVVFGCEAGNGWGERYGKCSITLCTDGSSSVTRSGELRDEEHKLEASSSAWAVCYVEDEFLQSYTTLPCEQQLTLSHMQFLSVWGAGISCKVSHGIYMAELQAVLRAIASVPIGWDVHVVMDSKSALQAIRTYADASTDRQRLRMEGRPMLAMIGKQVQLRQQHGGAVSMRHTMAHTSGSGIDAVGNRCADVVAGAERVAMLHGRDPTGAASLPSLDISQGEAWLCIEQKCEASVAVSDVPITGDVRRTARKCLAQHAHVKWKGSSRQARFSTDLALVYQYRWLVKEAAPPLAKCVPFFLRLATDTVHVWWDASDEKEHVKLRECAACDDGSVRDVTHMLQCVHDAVSRQQVLQELLDATRSIAGHVPNVVKWLATVDVGSPDALSAVLFDVFGCRDGPVRLLYGGFSLSEGRRAMAKLGLYAGMKNAQDVEYRVAMMAAWRAELFSYAHRAWCAGMSVL